MKEAVPASPAKPPAFKAKPVPASTHRSKMQSFTVEKLMREERVKQRSAVLLAAAKLPSRQEQHEREKEEQRSEGRREHVSPVKPPIRELLPAVLRNAP